MERLQPKVRLAPANPIVRLSVEKAAAPRPAVRVAVPGQEFACRATDPGDRPMDLVATLDDVDGSFRLQFG